MIYLYVFQRNHIFLYIKQKSDTKKALFRPTCFSICEIKSVKLKSRIYHVFMVDVWL